MSETTEIVKSQQFITVVETAQSALIKNQLSVDKAKEYGQTLLDTIEAAGMSDELDQKCNDFLVKIRKTDALLKERRNPVTQLFTQITKRFTSIEKEMADQAALIKAERDAYAKQKAEEQRRKEAEAQRKLNIEREKADTAAYAETELSKHFNKMLVAKQNAMLYLFDGVSLETFEQVTNGLKSVNTFMDLSEFEIFHPAITPRYITNDDVNLIINQVKQTKREYYSTLFNERVDEYRNELVDKLPSKKTELEAIAEAEKKNAEEAKRLKAERDEREKAEKERLAKEAADREAREKAAAEAKAQEAQMDSLFNATEETAVQGSQAQVRAGYTITITHPAGFVQVFSYWFENEGKNLSIDVAGRKSLNQMVAFCEKHAHKTGEKITSPYVKYEESFSTVAKA